MSIDFVFTLAHVVRAHKFLYYVPLYQLLISMVTVAVFCQTLYGSLLCNEKYKISHFGSHLQRRRIDPLIAKTSLPAIKKPLPIGAQRLVWDRAL